MTFSVGYIMFLLETEDVITGFVSCNSRRVMALLTGRETGSDQQFRLFLFQSLFRLDTMTYTCGLCSLGNIGIAGLRPTGKI